LKPKLNYDPEKAKKLLAQADSLVLMTNCKPRGPLDKQLTEA
jgi:hypothetical protein